MSTNHAQISGTTQFRMWYASTTSMDTNTYSGSFTTFSASNANQNVNILMRTYVTQYGLQMGEKMGATGFKITTNTFGDMVIGATVTFTDRTLAQICDYLNNYLYINATTNNSNMSQVMTDIRQFNWMGINNWNATGSATNNVRLTLGTGENNGSGTVQYSTDDGATWIELASAGADVAEGASVKFKFIPTKDSDVNKDSYVAGYTIGTTEVKDLKGQVAVITQAYTINADTVVKPAFVAKGETPVAPTDRKQGALRWVNTAANDKLTYAQALTFNYNTKAENSYILDSYFGTSWTYGENLLPDPTLYSDAKFANNQNITVGEANKYKPLVRITNQNPSKDTAFGSNIQAKDVKPGTFTQTVEADYYTASSVCSNHWYHVGGIQQHKDGISRTITIAKDTLSITGLNAEYTYGSPNDATVTPATNGTAGSQATVAPEKLKRTFKDANGNEVKDITKAVPGTYTVEFTYTGDDFIQEYTSDLSSTFTIKKAANTATAEAPTATKKNNSITLGNLKAGQVYSINGTNWYTKEQIEADNPFVGLDEGTEYTVRTKIAATDTHEESVVNTATKVTTDVTISGTISGDNVALPAEVTISDGTNAYTVKTDENGNYTRVVPVGTYSISVAGKDGLQAGTLASFKASKDSKSVPGITMKDTAKGTAKKFVESELKDKEGNIITEVTQDTLDQILASKDKFDKITDQNVKDAINEWMKGLTDPDKTYEKLVAEAEKYLNDTTSKFIEDHMTDGESSIITEAKRETFDKILGGEEDFNNLTQAQKDEVNRKLKAAGALNTYEELLANAKKQIEEEANKFIGTYVSDEEGNIYPEATADNYEQILSGMSDWEALSQSEKDAINKNLASAGSKTYEELLERAQEIKEKSDDFVKTYVSDKDGNVYKEVTKDNYEQIFAGKADWDKLTQEEKDAIDAKLVAAGSKPYLELLKEAEALKNSTDGFIQKHLTGHDGQIFKAATRGNYKQILGGLDDWNKLTQEQKDAINAKLLANGGKTYEELLKMAQDIQKQIEAEKKASATKTGDSAPIALYSLLAMFSLAGVALTERKKRYM